MTDVSLRDYFAQAGSRFTDADAKVIGPALDELAADGQLTPDAVLDRAHSPNSPLHSYFEWDDERAAHLYRRDQAATMIRVIKVRADDQDVPGERAFRRAVKPDQVQSNYRSMARHSGESDRAAETAAHALSELYAWRTKYQPYLDVWDGFAKAFTAVCSQIGEMDAESGALTNQKTITAMAELKEWRASYEQELLAWANLNEQVGFLLEAIEDCSKAFDRNAIKPRKCMRCEQMFMSEHVGNRMCLQCLNAANGVAA